MDLTLSQQEQSWIRQLLLSAPEPGPALLPRTALEALTRLVPCDIVSVVEADRLGYGLVRMDLPESALDLMGPRICEGPLHTGFEHLPDPAVYRSAPDPLGITGDLDTIRLGRATPAGTVVQLCLDRHGGFFTSRDVALVRLLEPALCRLMTARAWLTADRSLSPSELRVLELVASGSSNRDVAERLVISVATVRKHLEHCYRKLGVTNRTAAVAALTHGAE